MAMGQLVKITPPPKKPIFAATPTKWKHAEANAGVRFPHEYFDVEKIYGSGEFLDGSLEITNPIDPVYTKWIQHELSKLQAFISEFPEDVPHRIHPDPDGLYPFARDDNGNRFYWLTNGEPDSWPIVCRSESYDWESPLKHSLTEFLVLLFTNKLSIRRKNFWGSPFKKGQLVFIPQAPAKPLGATDE